MNDITDEQIAAAVRPLYTDDAAASMGLADDIRTARAVLALPCAHSCRHALDGKGLALRCASGCKEAAKEGRKG